MRQILPVFAMLTAGAFTASASVDTGLLALVPSNAQLIVGLDAQKTRNSDFGQFMILKSQTGDMHLQQFIDATGFDPRRDLQNVLMVAASNNGAGKGPSAYAVLARGVFDQGKIMATALTKNGVSQTFGGVSMVVYSGKNQSTALAFPEVGVAVMADLATLQQIITNRSNPTSLDADLMTRINSVGNANDAWFVSTTGVAAWANGDNSKNANGQGAPQMQALQSIRSASGGMKSGTTVDFSFNATARSPQDATSLADVFRFAASAVQMQRQKTPEMGLLATALDNMILTISGSTVSVAFSVPEKGLEQLAALAPTKQNKQ